MCYSYNNGTGEFGRCEDGENCTRLHICQKYLRGACQCHRSHDFYEPHPLKTLQERGVPTELMGIMKDLYTNIEALRSLSKTQQPSATNPAGQRTRRGPKTQNQRPYDPFHVNKGQKSQTGNKSQLNTNDIIFTTVTLNPTLLVLVNIQHWHEWLLMLKSFNCVCVILPSEKTEICMYFIKGHCKHGGKIFTHQIIWESLYTSEL